MSAFLRPGQKTSKAFGVSFESDRETDAPAPLLYNSNERLALEDQRRRLPVAQHRCLWNPPLEINGRSKVWAPNPPSSSCLACLHPWHGAVRGLCLGVSLEMQGPGDLVGCMDHR